MRTLYFDCSMGAAGDMLMGALYELLEDQKFYLEIMNRLFPGVTVVARRETPSRYMGLIWMYGSMEKRKGRSSKVEAVSDFPLERRKPPL